MKNGKSIESGEKTAREKALWGTGRLGRASRPSPP